MTLTYIPQRNDHDCGVAALAMACGVTYEDVAAIQGNSRGEGLHEGHNQDWLIQNGFAWQVLEPYHPGPGGASEKRSPWPPLPFAPTHLVLVEATKGWHYTTMDRDGTVFDPFNDQRKALDHPDYKRVSTILGIWPVGQR